MPRLPAGMRRAGDQWVCLDVTLALGHTKPEQGEPGCPAKLSVTQVDLWGQSCEEKGQLLESEATSEDR